MTDRHPDDRSVDEGLVSMLYDILGLPVLDGDRLEVLGAVAGPAGSSAIHLPDGGVWEVDHLDPAIPVRFEVDAADADRSPLLVAAFGGDGALYLADEAIDLSVERPAGSSGDTWSDMAGAHRRPNRRDYQRSLEQRRADDPDVVAGRVVVLVDLAEDSRSHPLAQIAAIAELVVRAFGVSGGELLLPVLPGLVAAADELTPEVDPEELQLLDAALLGRLASAVARAARSGRRSRSPLMDLADRARHLSGLRRPVNTDAVAPAAADGDAVPATVLRLDAMTASTYRVHDDGGATSAGNEGVDRRRADNQQSDNHLADNQQAGIQRVGQQHADTYLDVSRQADSLLRVAVARATEQRWIRVLYRDEQVPLAQAPLRPRDLVEVAELVIPPHIADDDLHVEVVEPRGLDVLADHPMDVIRRAVEVGRDAARVTRVHGVDPAGSLWQECAELWRLVGDDDRAGIARTLAAGIAGPPVRAYLADEVTDALGGID